MAVVNEVITEFKFKGDTKPLSSYRETLSGSIAGTLKFAAVATAAAAAVGYMVKSTLAGVDSQYELSKTIGVSVEAIQELSYAASVSGSNAGAMTSTLSNLSSKIGEAALKGSDDFARLGLSVYGANGELKSSDKLLGDISKRFKGMDLTQQASYADALGIDKTLLQLLNKTTGEMDAMREKARALGVVTGKEAEAVDKYNDSLITLSYGLKAVAIQASIGLAPSIGLAADAFTDFLIANKELIKNGIGKVMDIITSLIQFLGRVWTAIDNVIESTIGWTGVLVGLAAAFAFLNPYKTLFTLIALAVDDLTIAFSGGDSVIMGYLETTGNMGIAAALAGVAIAYLAMTTLPILVGVISGTVIPAILAMGAAVMANPIVAALTAVALVAGLIYDNWDGFSKYFIDLWKSITDSLPDFDSWIPDWMKDMFGSGDKKITIDGKGFSGQLKNPELSGAIHSSASNTNSVSQEIQINVSSEGAAKQIASEMRGEIQAAHDQLGRGGR